MEIKKEWGKVGKRGLGSDVPKDIYVKQLASLVEFESDFDAGGKSYRVSELAAMIEENSGGMRMVIRAIGDIEKSFVDGLIFYTSVIKTDRFRASHLREKGIIEVSIAGAQGFDNSTRPLGGYKLRLPDGNGSEDWRNPNYSQLIGYDNYGILAENININNVRSVAQLKLMGKMYKNVIAQIIEFAQKEK